MTTRRRPAIAPGRCSPWRESRVGRERHRVCSAVRSRAGGARRRGRDRSGTSSRRARRSGDAGRRCARRSRGRGARGGARAPARARPAPRSPRPLSSGPSPRFRQPAASRSAPWSEPPPAWLSRERVSLPSNGRFYVVAGSSWLRTAPCGARRRPRWARLRRRQAQARRHRPPRAPGALRGRSSANPGGKRSGSGGRST